MERKSRKTTLRPFQKVLKLMLNGKPLMKEDLPKIFGKDFLMYKVSSYILDIKIFSGAPVKVIKDGRKVISYQLLDIEKGKKYLEKIGKMGVNVPEIENLGDLNAQSESPTVDVSEPVVATESEMVVTEITE